ncbi:unnamed protein product, partial [Nesidiocoris tenuis]
MGRCRFPHRCSLPGGLAASDFKTETSTGLAVCAQQPQVVSLCGSVGGATESGALSPTSQKKGLTGQFIITRAVSNNVLSQLLSMPAFASSLRPSPEEEQFCVDIAKAAKKLSPLIVPCYPPCRETLSDARENLYDAVQKTNGPLISKLLRGTLIFPSTELPSALSHHVISGLALICLSLRLRLKRAYNTTNCCRPLTYKQTVFSTPSISSTYPSSIQPKVAWMHFEQSAILAVHSHVITRNPRITVSHENRQVWNLHIADVREEDGGTYMCQINTATAKTQLGYLNVVEVPHYCRRLRMSAEARVTLRTVLFRISIVI